MKLFSALILLLLYQTSYCQKRWLLWTHHDGKIEVVNGLSFGIGSYLEKRSDVNGIKFDIPGIGLFLPMGISADPYFQENDSLTWVEYEKKLDSLYSNNSNLLKTNGIYISASGDGEGIVNGFNIHPIGGLTKISNGVLLSGIMGFGTKVNGLSITGIYSSLGNSNGLIISGLYNYVVEMRGVQIALFNKSVKTRGFQIGLWNINEKRKLPLINWSF